MRLSQTPPESSAAGNFLTSRFSRYRAQADVSTPAGTGPMPGCPARVPSATGRGPRGKSALPEGALRFAVRIVIRERVISSLG
jgi:hypothetical protein